MHVENVDNCLFLIAFMLFLAKIIELENLEDVPLFFSFLTTST